MMQSASAISCACHGFGKKFFCLVDALGYFGLNHRLTIKAGHFHLLISSYNNAFSMGDILCCKRVFNAGSTILFYLEGDPHLLSLTF